MKIKPTDFYLTKMIETIRWWNDIFNKLKENKWDWGQDDQLEAVVSGGTHRKQP